MAAYIERDIEHSLRQCLETFPAVAVTGPRQSGKTTLVRRMLPNYRYLSLDDPLIREQAERDPDLLLDSAGDHVILDEIQNVGSLMPHIKRRIDERRDEVGRFVITGSQQFALMKGLSESLAGRVAVLELLPFSLTEMRRADGGTDGDLDPTGRFVSACLRGMYPEPVTHPRMSPERWYASYVQTYLERDVRSVYDVGSLRDFERFLQMLATRCSQILNMSSIASDVGVAVNTVKRWLSILEAGRVVMLLEPYYTNLGKRLVRSPKVYFVDVGLVCYLTRIRDADHLLHGPMSGALFECLCVLEAAKAVINAGAVPRLSYLRTHAGLEVDLLVEGANGRLVPFEFKMARTPRADMASAISRFRKDFAALSPEIGAVVSLSDRTDILTPDARLLPLAQFGETVREACVT